MSTSPSYVSLKTNTNCFAWPSHAGTTSDRSDAPLVEEQKSPCSPGSEAPSADSSRKRGSERSSAHSRHRSSHSDSGPVGGAPGPSVGRRYDRLTRGFSLCRFFNLLFYLISLNHSNVPAMIFSLL